MNGKILLRSGNVVNLEPLRIDTVDLLVEDGRVVERGRRLPTPEGCEIVDCRGRFVLPGFVDARAGLLDVQTLGMPPVETPDSTPSSLLESQRLRSDRVARAHAPETLVTAAFAGALEAIRCGTTTVLDLHASPTCAEDSLNLLRDVLLTVGLRSGLGYAVSDDEDPEAGLRECLRYLGEARGDKVAALVGGTDVELLSDPTLARLAEIAVERPLHLSARAPGAVRRLEAAGLLGPRTALAHASPLAAEELRALRDSGTWVIHCPTADARAALPPLALEELGELVALGSASAPGDMFTELRAAFDRARQSGRAVSPEDVVRLAVGGHQLASELLEVEIGSTRRDAGADFVILKYHPRTPIRSDNVAEHLVFGMGAQHVESVMIDGRFVLRDGRYPEIDTRKLAPLMRKGARQLWEAVAPSAPAAE